MARLFDRVATLFLARPRPGSFNREQPNAITIRDLRFQFEVEKSRDSEPNKGAIVVSNLSRRSRSELEKRPLIARLEAGYGTSPKRLFVGDVRHAESVRTETGWETSLELGDGDRSFRFGRIARSFRAGVSRADALRGVARSMGFELDSGTLGRRELQRQFQAGLTLFGPSRDELDRLLAPAGLGWTMQGGRLEVFKIGQVREDRALVISREHGLIGVPEFGSPEQKGKPPTLKARTLLYPEIRPGGKISMTSRSVQGLFRVDRVVHSGDTHGDEWVTEIEAIPL